MSLTFMVQSKMNYVYFVLAKGRMHMYTIFILCICINITKTNSDRKEMMC